MSPPSLRTTTVLHCRAPHVEACPCPSRLFTVPVRLLAARSHAFTSREFEAVVSPGDPISVVFPLPPEADARIVTEPVPYPTDLSWNGVPARLVQVRLGLPVLEVPQPRAFRLLALLPLGEVEGLPSLLRLGAEFL
jgi:hypothetical protein